MDTALGMDESYCSQQAEEFVESIETALKDAKWEGEITIGSEKKCGVGRGCLVPMRSPLTV